MKCEWNELVECGATYHVEVDSYCGTEVVFLLVIDGGTIAII